MNTAALVFFLGGASYLGLLLLLEALVSLRKKDSTKGTVADMMKTCLAYQFGTLLMVIGIGIKAFIP